MTYSYSVSFEHDTKPVLTARGPVEASDWSEAVRKAVRRAEAELKPRNYRSVVAVVELRDLG